MNIKELKSNYYLYGNKGALWSNQAHIAKSSEPTTLCGTPMLATNHCRLNGVQEIGCKECLQKYNEK